MDRAGGTPDGRLHGPCSWSAKPARVPVGRGRRAHYRRDALATLSKALSWFDERLARGETALATVFLVSMILLASLNAALRNFSLAGFGWANAAMASLDWVDVFLQQGTLWLAFLGASLATRQGRHIGIDVLPRLLGPRPRQLVLALTALFAAVVTFVLAQAFWASVELNAAEDAVYRIYEGDTQVHICDAGAATVAALEGVERPDLFCVARSFFALIGVPIQNGKAPLQMVVPVMFLVIGIRLFAKGLLAGLRFGGLAPLEGEGEGEGEGQGEGEAERGASDEGASV